MKMKNYIFPAALTLLLLTAASCEKEKFDEPQIPDEMKERIEFSMSDPQGTGSPRTKAGFEYATQIIARVESFKSTTVGGTPSTSNTDKRSTRMVLTADSHSSHGNQYSSVSPSSNNEARFWDDCFGRYANLSVYAVAVPGKTNLTNGSTHKTLENLISYGGESVSTTNTVWKTEGTDNTSNNNITWEVSKGIRTTGTSITGQTAETIANEDLTYSNNIQSSGSNGVYRWDYNETTPGYPAFSEDFTTLKNGVLRFALPGTDETAPGHFDKGHLIFNHALTRLTINLKRGDGFGADAGYFKFNKEGSTDDTNIKIINVPVKNTLNIQSGAWSTTESDITKGSIEKISSATTKDGFDYSLMAQFIPGYTFKKNDNTNVLEFTIDDNTYYVTQQMIWKGLNDNSGSGTGKNGLASDVDSYTMEQGKNYILDITVKKTGIQNVTATLVEWGKVQAANIDANNSYISITSGTMEAQGTKCDHFDLYRLDAGVNDIYTNQNGGSLPEMKNWGGNYTDKATLTKDTNYDTNGKWSTNWYWASNKSFYHFRSIDKGVTLQGTTEETDDFFNVYSGPVNNTWSESGEPLVANISNAVNDKNYNDYHWGAPMKSGATLTYNTNSGTNEGYSESLYQAIGSTTDQINMIEQHMMSTVHFVIHTGTKSNGTAVTDGAVTLLDGSNNGTRLSLTNFAGTGMIKMGNGYITPSDSYISSDIPVPGATTITYSDANVLTSLQTTSEDYFETASTKTKSYDYRVVPQVLYHGSGSADSDETLSNFIGLTIVTPDNNQYYVIKKLYGVVGTINNNGNKNEHQATEGKASITRWYPGYDYTYHIYINKTGIEAVTCTVVDWVNVEGNVGDINLES